VLYLATRPRYRSLALFGRLDRPRRREITDLLRLGLPIGLTILFEAGYFSVSGLLISSLGATPVAGHQVAINFAAMSFMIPLGVAMATTVRVGHALGRGEPRAARFTAWVGIGLALSAQTVSAAVMLLAPSQIAGLYTRDPEVARVAVRLLFLAALFQLSDGLQVGSAGALRGFKDTRAPLLITLVAYWFVGLPVGLTLGIAGGLGARGIWMGMIAGLTVAAALLLGRLVRVSRRRLAAPAGASS
jgi:MATE family multidrug resistance protein